MQLTDRYGKSITDNQQVTLWEGNFNANSGDITLSDNIYNYSKLIFIRLATDVLGASCSVYILDGESLLHGSAVAGNCRMMRLAISKMSTSKNSIHIDGANYYSINENKETLKFEKVIGIKKL